MADADTSSPGAVVLVSATVCRSRSGISGPEELWGRMRSNHRVSDSGALSYLNILPHTARDCLPLTFPIS